MNFAFTALDASGAKISERVTGDSADHALQQLQSRGLIVLALTADAARDKAREKNASVKSKQARGRVKPEQVAVLTREFAILIETGVPLVEALGLLHQHADTPTLALALEEARADLSGGKTLAQALGAQPHVFPKFYVDMMRMAEAGGQLDTTLRQAADYIEASLDMRRKVIGAITYPAVVLCVGVLVLIFTLTYLMPKFAGLFAQMHTDMPASTRFLIDSSAFVRRYWYALPIFVAAGVWGGRLALAAPRVKMLLLRAAHKIPGIGTLIQKVAVARLLRALGALTETGVTLLVALEAAGPTAGNAIFEAAVVSVGQRVEQGVSLSDAVASTGVFPGIVCQMLTVGERSGRLGEVLMRVAVFYEREVDARLKTLSTVIEPMLIVVLGLLVGFIAVSVIEPIYSLVSSVK